MSIRYTSTVLAVALSIAFPSAFAVSPEDEALIVVTATRFNSVPQELPIAAQVITADAIRDSSATTVSEVLSKLGGVHTRINFTGVPDTPIDLRGFGMTGDSNTLVLVNGQRISENESATARLSVIPLDAIERIEILRGMGAVLYGGGATSGTINIITRAPIASGLSGNVSALAGGHGLRDMRGGIRYGDGNWGLSLNAQHYENDNYRKNNRAEQDAVSGELRFGGRDDFIAMGFNAEDQKGRLPGARTEAQLSTDPRGTGTPNDYANSDSQMYTLRGEKRYGDVTLAMDIGQRDKGAHSFFDFGGGATSKMDTKTDVTTVSPRLLWKSRLAGAENRLTVGLDWSDWSYSSNTLGTAWASTTSEVGEQSNRAVYFRNELSFSTGTRLSLGSRRESVRQSQEEYLTPMPKRSENHHLSAHELALEQKFGEGFSAYGRIGKSFRIANIDENRCYPWALPCTPLLKPQRSRDREIGMQWRGKRADFRAGLFDMAIDDEIHYMNIGPGLFGSNINLPPTRHRGLELEGKLFIGDSVDLAARYTHTQARFRKGIFGGVDVTGKDVPLVPKERIGLNLGWQITAATRLGFNVVYVGRQHYDNDQANLFRKMPSYTVSDVKLSHELGAWRFAAGINNLFDEKYYSHGTVNGAYTTFTAYPEDRRNAYASVEYKF